MSAPRLQWVGGDVTKAAPGCLLRWKAHKSDAWEYGYWRGTEHRMLTFSDSPVGPVTRWAVLGHPFMQVQIVTRDTEAAS